MDAPHIAHVIAPQFADCPDCGSPETHQTAPAGPGSRTTYACGDCGHEWQQVTPEPPEVWA